jgi:hypothetical protein
MPDNCPTWTKNEWYDIMRSRWSRRGEVVSVFDALALAVIDLLAGSSFLVQTSVPPSTAVCQNEKGGAVAISESGR